MHRSAAEPRPLVRTLIALGLLGQYLLFHGDPGFGAALWFALVCAIAALATARPAADIGAGAQLPIAGALLFALALGWRDSEALHALLLLAIVGSLALAALPRLGTSLVAGSLWSWASPLVHWGLSALRLPLRAAAALASSRERVVSGSPRTLALLRGAALALPALLVLGALLASAEPAFARVLLGGLDLGALLGRVWRTALAVWLAAALLQAVFAEARPTDPEGERLRWNPGAIEVITALGLVALLFAVFCAVQLPNLFGGTERVLREAGLTYAEYARSGFFQLCAAAAVSLVVLLAGAGLPEEVGAAVRRWHRGVSLAVVAGVAVIVASAFHRLGLYVDAYGLTTDRLLAFAAMCGMSAMFAWLTFTLLTARLQRFAFGALAIVQLTLLTLVVVDPEATVARTNRERLLARWSERGVARGDVEDMLGGLGADAVPTVGAGLERLPADQAAALQAWLEGQRQREVQRDSDWRDLTLGRLTARRALASLPAPPPPAVEPVAVDTTDATH